MNQEALADDTTALLRENQALTVRIAELEERLIFAENSKQLLRADHLLRRKRWQRELADAVTECHQWSERVEWIVSCGAIAIFFEGKAVEIRRVYHYSDHKVLSDGQTSVPAALDDAILKDEAWQKHRNKLPAKE